MGKARYRPEQIIPMLREGEVEIGKGMTVREVCRKLGSRSTPIITGAKSMVG